jgi:hypothetical protein
VHHFLELLLAGGALRWTDLHLVCRWWRDSVVWHSRVSTMDVGWWTCAGWWHCPASWWCWWQASQY